jgi:hypothetical protein
VVGVDADHPQGLLEGEFDFESDAVETNDVDRVERQICGQQNDSPPGGVLDGDEADRATQWAPDQVGDAG